ncbi:MAG: SDR family oxidoreductase [Thermoplasmata archaeon]
MIGTDRVPRLLLVGGGGGLVGRNILQEFLPTWRIRSVHRHAAHLEAGSPVEWIPTDVAALRDWDPLLDDIDAIVNVAWYRAGPPTLFRNLHDGLLRLLDAARRRGVRRFIHVSVPLAPLPLEEGFPYLAYKRRFDRALAESGLSYRIVRPTMLFAPHDVLITVMLRTMHRYRAFPMFGDGAYHVSPIAATDLAYVLRCSAEGSAVGTVDLGGPERMTYLELTDRLFASLGQPARYWRMSERNGVRLARLLERFGSHLLYAYEVEWLVSDMLGLPPAEGLGRPLTPVGPFIEAESRRLRSPAPTGARARAPGR